MGQRQRRRREPVDDVTTWKGLTKWAREQVDMRKLQREYWRYVLTLDLLRAELLARKAIAKK